MWHLGSKVNRERKVELHEQYFLQSWCVVVVVFVAGYFGLM